MENLKIERDNTKILVIRQTLAETVLADLSTFATMLFFIGIGVIAHSTVMQILGAIAGVFFIFLRSFDKNTKNVTPDQAVDILLIEYSKKKSIDISV